MLILLRGTGGSIELKVIPKSMCTILTESDKCGTLKRQRKKEITVKPVNCWKVTRKYIGETTGR
jgi:hypothetical protein